MAISLAATGGTRPTRRRMAAPTSAPTGEPAPAECKRCGAEYWPSQGQGGRCGYCVAHPDAPVGPATDDYRPGKVERRAARATRVATTTAQAPAEALLALLADGRPRTRNDLSRGQRAMVRVLARAGKLVQVHVAGPAGERVAWTVPPAK